MTRAEMSGAVKAFEQAATEADEQPCPNANNHEDEETDHDEQSPAKLRRLPGVQR